MAEKESYYLSGGFDDTSASSPDAASSSPSLDSDSYVSSDSYAPPASKRRTKSYPRLPRRPLLHFIKNEWRNLPREESPSPSYHENIFERPRRWWRVCLQILSAPRLRRLLLVCFVLMCLTSATWFGWLRPIVEEQLSLNRSLSEEGKNELGWYGTNARPAFSDMIQLRTLSKKLLPSPGPEQNPDQEGKRLIFVGDVHGCHFELVALLDKLHFSEHNDHLILTGDMISKGPDSRGVIDLAMKLGASAVRGNHEDRVLLLRRDLEALGEIEPEANDNKDSGDKDGLNALDANGATEAENHTLTSPFTHHDPPSPARLLARKLSRKQVSWLASCPVILRVGAVPNLGEVVVVHGGLVPSVSLEAQDPISVMNMRTIDLKTHVPSKEHEGVPWYKLWNRAQDRIYRSSRPRWSIARTSYPQPADSKEDDQVVDSQGQRHPRPTPTIVIYGHDSKRGLQDHKWSKGLDTGCVSGGKLTALIIGEGGRMEKVQVKCDDHRPRKPLQVEVEEALGYGT